MHDLHPHPGTRGRYLDFSYGLLSANKPAGILTRLGADGKPVLDPKSDLKGKKIVDVKGWAPTSDGMSLVNNWCTGKRYNGYEILNPCIQKFMETEEYYKACEKHKFTKYCYPNKFFPAKDAGSDKPWMLTTDKQPAGGCKTGYCDCEAGVSVE